MKSEPDLILVRIAVALTGGPPVGAEVLIDPSDPWMQARLRNQTIVIVEPNKQPMGGGS